MTAAILWLKTRARWKETSIHEMEGKLDTNVTFVTTYEERPSSLLETNEATTCPARQQSREA